MVRHGKKAELVTLSVELHFICYELETLSEEFIIQKKKELRKIGMA